MTKQARAALGINVNSLIPYEVAIFLDSVTDSKLLKQHLLTDLFRVSKVGEIGENPIEWLHLNIRNVDILCLSSEFHGLPAAFLLQEAKRLRPNLITIVVSRVITREILKELQDAGLNSFLLSPFSKKSVYERFAAILGRTDLVSKIEIAQEESQNMEIKNLSIPPLPSVMINVLQFDPSAIENGSLELEKIINPDKAISLDIIKISNSSFYGRSGSIRNLKEAITLLGLKTVKNLVILQSRKQFSKDLSHPDLKKYVTELPVLSALVALDLVEPFSLEKVSEGLFSYTLLRKIGMMILALNFPERYLKVITRMHENHRSQFHIEMDEFGGASSIEVGKKVFSHWKMPQVYLDLASNLNFSIHAIEGVSHFDRITAISEIIAKRLMNLPILEIELEKESKIFDFYKANSKVRNIFNDDYFNLMKEHPYNIP